MMNLRRCGNLNDLSHSPTAGVVLASLMISYYTVGKNDEE
jgi:hypothetical protein